MREKEIYIELLKKQIVNDITVQCNLIGRTMQKSDETAEAASEIMSPDDEYTKPIVARAMTEAFGEVKRVCQRYLIAGRDTDDNRLERINEMDKKEETVTASASGTEGTYGMTATMPYIIRVECSEPVKVKTSSGKELGDALGLAQFEYTPTAANEKLSIVGDNSAKVEITYFYGDFGSYKIDLLMPSNFNISMTETIKSCAHRMIVDYTMKSVLANQLADKAQEYAALFKGDSDGLRDALRARVMLMGRRPTDWS